ncbi:MAG TPA: hypothetical protein VJW93_00645, partial [Candidatus Acidoferrales bacterium]|nr:hypothetical protein [Candidatus Acidoferrales bacterium]
LSRPKIRRRFRVQISPSWAGSPRLNFVSLKLYEEAVTQRQHSDGTQGRARTLETDQEAFEV